MPTTRVILLVEEDAVCRGFLADNLTADGYEVIVAGDRTNALNKLEDDPDLVLCDVIGETLDLIDAVREGDGLAACIDPATPLIVLTRHADALMRVRYFEHGSDDVIRKPFNYRELLARIEAVLRRTHEPPKGRVVRIGELRIDVQARAVSVRGTTIELAAREYALLLYLAGEPNRVFTKDELLRDVWGFRSRGVTRTLDSHAIKLRTKLRAQGKTQWVENVWGVGYRLAPVGPGDSVRDVA
jgi:DNA-binding response OmpR family regulator